MDVDTTTASGRDVQGVTKNEGHSSLNPAPGSSPKDIDYGGDDFLGRLNNGMTQNSAGLGVALATLTFSINLTGYLNTRFGAPLRAEIVARLSRFGGKQLAREIQPDSPTPFFLAPVSTLIMDHRRSVRLTSLLGLYVRMRSLCTTKADPVVRLLTVVQCAAYITFQAMENVYHLQNKGVVTRAVIDRCGGVTEWIAWSCRAWCLGVLLDFCRLWREAALTEDRDKGKWWSDLAVSACWLPVAVNASFYPTGITLMNPGLSSLLSLMAMSRSLQSHWRATAYQ